MNGVNGVNGVNGTRSKHDISSLKVNQSRLMDAIHTGCKYGAAHRYGEYVLMPNSASRISTYDFLTAITQRQAWPGSA